MSIYKPAEDSEFFVEFLKDYFSKLKTKNLRFLDVGTGSGILAETAIEFLGKENVLAVDINPEAVEFVRKKKIEVLKSDLFSNPKLKGKKFDLIVFNAPYLPEDENEPKDSRLATTGGKKGDEVVLRFLENVRDYLNKGGKVFVLVSSLTPLENIKKFGMKIVAKKKIFFEELLILGF